MAGVCENTINVICGTKVTNERKVSAFNSNGEPIDVVLYLCGHCGQEVPKLADDTCQVCDAAYRHKKTIDNPKTGCVHYIFECDCNGNGNLAQKIVKYP